MIKSSRNKFIGAHVTPEIHATIRELAKAQGESASLFIAGVLRQTVIDAGISLQPVDRGEKLPFDDEFDESADERAREADIEGQ